MKLRRFLLLALGILPRKNRKTRAITRYQRRHFGGNEVVKS